MKSSLDRLTQQFTTLIGPEAFARAKAAAEAAVKAAAEAAAKAAAAAAAAKAAAAAAAKPAAPTVSQTASAASGVAGLAEPGPGSPTPATTAKPAVVLTGSGIAASPKPVAATALTTTSAAPVPVAAPKPAAPAAPRPAPAPAVPPPPPLPLQSTVHAQKGYDLDAIVAPNQVVDAATLLDREGFGLDAVTGVDWPAQNEMEVVYDYFHPTESLRVVVRTRIPRATPELPTISAVFPGANWHERETHDFFGIRFTGHPNLKPFLLPEDATFHPLRKDYTP